MRSQQSIALCIPAYNAALYLPRLLESARQQLIPFDEILVYNDCSTDHTAEISRSYGAKVVDGIMNKGCSYGKNKLTSVTECEWVHFHDADDELLENFTILAHKWLINSNDFDVVLFNYEYRYNDSNELIAVSDFNDEELQNDPIRYAILNQINPFCGLYNRNELLRVGGYDIEPKILYNEDVAFHCKLAINGFRFRAEKEVSIVNYRIENSMSIANALKCNVAHYHVMKAIGAQVGHLYADEIAIKLLSNANVLASFSDWPTVKKSIDEAKKLIGCKSPIGNIFFKIMFAVSPLNTYKIREKLIRIFKPHLRNFN